MSVHRAISDAPFRPYRKAALLALSVALASGPVVLVAISSADAAPTTGSLISSAPIPITLPLRTVAIDTTIPRGVGIVATWGTSSASNSIKVYDCDMSLRN